MKHPIIQVAGISSLNQAMLMAELGVTHLGFPFGLNFNSEDTTVEEAAWIIGKIPPATKPVLITYLDKATEIFALMSRLGCRIVQLHGKISNQEILYLKKLFPKVEVWKSLVINPNSPDDVFLMLHKFNNLANAFITDTFDPQTGASGATGKTHDWSISRKIISETRKPVIVAGGLNPRNVFEAVIQTRPGGVDVHTGVEGADGLKRKDLVELFVKNALRGFDKIN